MTDCGPCTGRRATPAELPLQGGGYTITHTVDGREVTERYGSFIPAQRQAIELGLPPSAVVDAI